MHASVQKVSSILAGVGTGVVENEIGVFQFMVALQKLRDTVNEKHKDLPGDGSLNDHVGVHALSIQSADDGEVFLFRFLLQGDVLPSRDPSPSVPVREVKPHLV